MDPFSYNPGPGYQQNPQIQTMTSDPAAPVGPPAASPPPDYGIAHGGRPNGYWDRMARHRAQRQSRQGQPQPMPSPGLQSGPPQGFPGQGNHFGWGQGNGQPPWMQDWGRFMAPSQMPNTQFPLNPNSFGNDAMPQPMPPMVEMQQAPSPGFQAPPMMQRPRFQMGGMGGFGMRGGG